MNTNAEKDALERSWNTMKLHPKYHESFVKVHESLMKSDGPLNYINRHFIAIMAASRHYCSEMICHHASILQEKTTHASASDTSIRAWLKSGFRLNDAAEKFQKLDKVNMIMAHRPWMITKEHIIELTKKMEGSIGLQGWSLNQVTQAITLLAHIHSFSSFILGCGIMENSHDDTQKEPSDNDEETESSIIPSSPTDSDVKGSADENQLISEDLLKVPTIVAKMETLGTEIEELELSELARRFEKIEKSQAEDVVDLTVKDEITVQYRRACSQTKEDLDPGEVDIETENELLPNNFTNSLDCYQYTDFVKRENPDIYRTLRDGEFSWGEHAFSVISRFYGDNISRILDKKFMTIDNLTYMNIGSYTSVDTRYVSYHMRIGRMNSYIL